MAVTTAVGVDVSKKKLDVVLLIDSKAKSKVVSNTPEGYKELVDWLVKQKVALAAFMCAWKRPASIANHSPCGCTMLEFK